MCKEAETMETLALRLEYARLKGLPRPPGLVRDIRAPLRTYADALREIVERWRKESGQ